MGGKGISRSVKMEQISMRQLHFDINGTAGTPVASGFSKADIASVIDNSTGNYTILLKRPFNLKNVNKAKAMVQSLTPQRSTAITAVAHDRITIEVTDLAGVAADADLSILMIGSDFKLNH